MLAENVIPRCNSAEKTLSDAKEALAKCENETKGKQEELDVMGMNVLYKKQQDITARVALIDHAKTMLKNLD